MSVLRFFLYLNISLNLAGTLMTPAFAAEDDPVSGKELYHDYCSVCHGDRGDGHSRAREGLATMPRDFTQPGLRDVLSSEQMTDIILNGRPGTAMVGWKSRLSQAHAESITDYIRSAFMSPQAFDDQKTATIPAADINTPPHEIVMDQPMLYGLAGNRETGEKFYNANCATCHGTDGDGNGPRAYFIFPKPRDFLAENSRMRLNRPALFNAIKYGIRGKEMPAWGKVIDDQQIADVTEYVFSNFIRKSSE